MSEEKTTSYRLEYAHSGRSSCKGPKPCTGTNIPKGALRLGTPVDFRGNKSFAWRHWGCTTKKVIENIKKNFEDASELDGYEDLKPEDQAKIRQAYRDGHVANEDIPETARKPAREEGGEKIDEEKPKKEHDHAKKKVVDEDSEKPKNKRAPRKKAEDAGKKAETAAPKEWASKKKQEGDEFGDFSKELDDVPAEDGNDEGAAEKPAEKVKEKAKEALVEGLGESSTFAAYVDRHRTRPVSPTFHHALDQERRNHRRSHPGGVAPTTGESLDSVLERVEKCEQALDGIRHASLENKVDQNSDNVSKIMTDLENFRNETHKFFAEMITALGDRHKHNPYTCEDCLKHPALLPPLPDFMKGVAWNPPHRQRPGRVGAHTFHG
ncbi:zf-PARP-domain-containing protein [Pluteus cervinus]|uniref:Zf-PARP-domain-containing protein n=1 Tax=Pluteus cervinus TaxID=181527 RepID=A0ACD3AYV7_9AGAR|nr:zf-PARP-domain-containing protein [Pluteus cervinus]